MYRCFPGCDVKTESKEKMLYYSACASCSVQRTHKAVWFQETAINAATADNALRTTFLQKSTGVCAAKTVRNTATATGCEHFTDHALWVSNTGLANLIPRVSVLLDQLSENESSGSDPVLK